MSYIKNWLVDMLFPRRCPVCGDVVMPKGMLICPSCIGQLELVREPLCKKCGKELFSDQEEYCFNCRQHHFSYDAGRSLFKYNAAAGASMAAIKYKNRREYLDFYAQAMARWFRQQVQEWNPDVLTAVPIHPVRQRLRGFNQAEELALRLSRSWKIPVDFNLIIRKKNTAPQKELGPSERLKNLRQAFAAVPGRSKIPETVLLLDDIYTTGSTLEACTGVLKAAGVKKVWFLTICMSYER